MPQQSIPASQVVQVTPNVLSAGGTALEIIGLCLTTNTRVPIGAVQPFADVAGVDDYFGPSSDEAAVARTYFAGYEGQSETPESMLFAQYNANAVAAYLRGGDISQLPLAQLQALNGSLNIVIDGYAHNVSAINLSSATSFSSAAGLIQTAFAAQQPTVANYTASIGATATGNGSGTNLTLSATTGLVSAGDVVAGVGVPVGTKILSQTSGSTGGNGVYVTDQATTASSASITVSSKVLNVTAVASGALAIGQNVDGFNVNDPTSITALGTGVGLAGTYILSGAAQNVASESMTSLAPNPTVTYDSVSGAFVVTSGITGAPSMIDFATGSLSASLLLTSLTGAVDSQGAAPATPAAFMDGLIEVTQNWVTFFNLYNPDDTGHANRLAFAEWTSQQSDGFAYIAWDQDPAPTNTVPANSSLGAAIADAQYSGTCLIWGSVTLAAFISGTAAAINFNQQEGRITFMFRRQDGVLPSVTNGTVAQNLEANGYNFYGGYATRNQNFNFFANGKVSGSFKWLDSYINQIWFNNNLQLAILTGLTNVGSVPYNADGYSLIESWCKQPINDALFFGAIQPGVTLSPAQATQINQAAGSQSVAGVLATRGWYLQILDASPSVRAVRGSPPCNLWYTDGGSVQKIELDSINVQ